MRGGVADLVGELESLATAHPLRERLRGQLMLALYRVGRQADALATYQEMRGLLDDQLGLQPSPALQQLQQAILRQDESLELPGPAAAAPQVNRGTAPSGGFVGRERELDEAEAALPTAGSAGGRAVLIVGAPGIGKTRLAEELSERAEAAGVRVAWGRCYAREAPPPYWPWRESIRALARDWSTAELAAAVGPDAAAIARLVPELGELLAPGRPEPLDDDPRQARFRLFDSVASFVVRAAAREPLLVVLDDLHAADADSLALLAFLAPRLRDGRLVVVCTLRDDESALDDPLAGALGALRRAGATLRIPLDGLPASALGELIAARTGSSPPPDLVAELHAGTDGNPLFVAEVARVALDQAPDGIAGEELRERFRAALPGGLRAAIALRMTALSADCRALLVAAATVGSELTVGRLRALSALESDDATLDAIEEAVRAGLLSDHPGQPGQHEFAHQLVRDAVLGQLSAMRRARLHVRAADALEQLYGAAVDARAAELANHLVAAGALAEPARLAHFAGRGAARALESQAYEEAQRLFGQALAARAGEPVDDEQAALLVGSARAALATLGLHDRRTFRAAVEHMRQAFDHYERAGDLERAVAVAALPVPPISRTTSVAEYRELTARALALVAPDSPAAGRLLASTGWFAGANEVDSEAATQAFETAVAIARRHGDTALEMRTLLNSAYVDFQHKRWGDCLAHASAALVLAERARDARAEIFARVWAARSALVLGESAAAREHIAASVTLAERLREPYWLNAAFLDATWMAVLEGRWDAARVAAERALAAEPSDSRTLACSALVEYECGRRGRGDEFVELLLDAYALTGDEPEAVANNVVAAFLPLLAGIAGGREAHRAVARDAAARAQAGAILHPLSRLLVDTGLGLAAVADGDAAAAAAHREALLDQSGTALLVAARSADRVLGLLAATAGDRAAARQHFERALAFCDAAGYRAEWAWTARDLVLLGAHGELLEPARATARALGMAALLEQLEPLPAP